MKKYNIAIVGATGAVGEELLRVLEELDFPVNDILPLASARSAGEIVEFKENEYKVQELTERSFDDNEIDIAFFSAGASISAKFVPYAVESGALVIDNTSHFRMQENVPLVVPECNPDDIKLWQDSGACGQDILKDAGKKRSPAIAHQEAGCAVAQQDITNEEGGYFFRGTSSEGSSLDIPRQVVDRDNDPAVSR